MALSEIGFRKASFVSREKDKDIFSADEIRFYEVFLEVLFAWVESPTLAFLCGNAVGKGEGC